MSIGGCELVAHLGVRVLTVLLEQLTFPSAFHGVPHCTYNLVYANMGLNQKTRTVWLAVSLAEERDHVQYTVAHKASFPPKL